LARTNRRRLDFEQMRDAMLAVSGDLDLAAGGPSVELTTAPFALRRTIYGRIDRQNLPGMFRTFDFANPDTHSPGRFQTTVPQQGLFMLNHPFVLERAKSLIKRIDQHGIADSRARIARLYQAVFARNPLADESAAATKFLEAATTNEPNGSPGQDVWPQLAQALLLANEFVFVD
jgi:hypothetical protein